MFTQNQVLNVHGQEVETTQMSFDRWMVKRAGICTFWNTTRQWKGMDDWYTQQRGWISKALSWVGGSQFQKVTNYILPNIAFLKWKNYKMENVLVVTKDQQWGGGESVPTEGPHEGFLGWWKCSVSPLSMSTSWLQYCTTQCEMFLFGQTG